MLAFLPFGCCVCGCVSRPSSAVACFGCPVCVWCSLAFAFLFGFPFRLAAGVLFRLPFFCVSGFAVVLVFALGLCVVAVSLFSPPAPSCPLSLGLSFGTFWSRQCSAGPSFRVSGCICYGPVAIPLVWCVVADWLLPSLLLMATKASALCGALPSTPCCGCGYGA